MVLHSKFLYCKNKQCHQFISSQTSTLLGKVCRTFWWEKYFGNTTSLLERKLFLHSVCLSWATLVHSSEECGLKRYFEVTRGRSWRGVAHSHYTLITRDQVMRFDPKLSPTWPFVGKCLSGGWVVFRQGFHHPASQWSCVLCSLFPQALLLWIISSYFSPFCSKHRGSRWGGKEGFRIHVFS